MLGITGYAVARHEMQPAANITPENALRSVDVAKAGPILNEYSFGGYLDFVGIAPFIDERAEAYGAAFTLRHDRALNLQNLPDFLALLDEYRIGVTLLLPRTPAVGLLDRLPEWQRVYSDDIACMSGARRNRPTRIDCGRGAITADAFVKQPLHNCRLGVDAAAALGLNCARSAAPTGGTAAIRESTPWIFKLSSSYSLLARSPAGWPATS